LNHNTIKYLYSLMWIYGDSVVNALCQSMFIHCYFIIIINCSRLKEQTQMFKAITIVF